MSLLLSLILAIMLNMFSKFDAMNRRHLHNKQQLVLCPFLLLLSQGRFFRRATKMEPQVFASLEGSLAILMAFEQLFARLPQAFNSFQEAAVRSHRWCFSEMLEQKQFAIFINVIFSGPIRVDHLSWSKNKRLLLHSKYTYSTYNFCQKTKQKTYNIEKNSLVCSTNMSFKPKNSK